MTQISTRLATADDVDALAVLFDAYRRFYQQAADLPRASAFIRERLVRHQSVVFVAESASGEMLGFCQLYPSFCSLVAAPIVILNDLFVLPAARKLGAGAALLQAAEAFARAQHFARMELTTAKTNLTAQSLYASQGWQRDEVYYAYNKVLSD
ncbi:N-acetyltransferase family protein [Niveibacterium sp.]|uniref:GNAT family N-acetyltransferase n=1 Tax=Niveibacterium sp. TaxID=2017444 RepID=UPI0035B422F6